MRLEDRIHPICLSDDELETVSGGNTFQNERGEELKEGRFITSKLANYASSDMPLYSVGDFVKIKWQVGSRMGVLCNAQIVGISESRTGGLLFRRFTYSVKIHSCPNSDMIGLVETGVHENCLYR